ncbi:MAG: hypothetical protein JST89_06510 [Cyanobacteria bacterium SZAS-4]|nr:hypothetical protein [Cyanobacteria bacterium SZAS-4]
MEIVGLILILLGGIGMFVSGIWLIICSFKKSVIWGLCYLFVPFASIAYVAVDWNRAMKPFLISVVSLVVVVTGALISPSVKDNISRRGAEEAAITP